MSFALALKLKEQNLPEPMCIVALSPWTDLTCSSESYQTNAEADPCLFAESLMQSAMFYANGDFHNPYVSPVFGNLEGLAPSLIYVGSLEMLVDDATHMAACLDRAGCFNELHIVDDMWHAYVLFGTPEANDALERIKDFISEQMQSEAL